MKRLDLILSERELPRVVRAIEAAGAPGYSVIRHVTGQGPHGSVSEGMEFSGLGANAHVVIFCEDEILERLRLGLRPLLDYYGGVGYVSDTQSL
ncbi:MAG: transcriptional regulator [Cyanobacteriota bacterium]|nr:transcriptional regulator [Cyanobacteriota bacterium]